MNKPYRKQYNDEEVIVNPITKNNPYLHTHDNRAKRRERPVRFRGNHKGHSLTVSGTIAYHRVIQYVEGKQIFHYVLKTK